MKPTFSAGTYLRLLLQDSFVREIPAGVHRPLRLESIAGHEVLIGFDGTRRWTETVKGGAFHAKCFWGALHQSTNRRATKAEIRVTLSPLGTLLCNTLPGQ